ncbi:MAG: hypothetical protein JWO70_267 [Betaproteobacteria bacterium]|nr:hypothetical protein [Betaproteobacteria bacterium]
MNDQDELARRIAKLLDESADGIGQPQRERLIAARKLALSKHHETTALAWVPAWAGNISRFTERPVMGVQYLIPIAALVLGLAGVAYMHSAPSSDIADIDAGLLTDELPINAYLDQGFDSWLKRSSR